MTKHIPTAEQANVPGGLMSFDPGTVPGQLPPNFGKQDYLRMPHDEGLIDPSRLTSSSAHTK